ncbi:MAG: type II toxin-antitoxin system ParD family antitoxin [Allosphingosinicella sp.]
MDERVAARPQQRLFLQQEEADVRQLSIELADEMAAIVDARIASARNASESEVIQEALELLAEQDAPLEEWEERELAASYDEWKANPMGGIPLEEVSRRLEERRGAFEPLHCQASLDRRQSAD